MFLAPKSRFQSLFLVRLEQWDFNLSITFYYLIHHWFVWGGFFCTDCLSHKFLISLIFLHGTHLFISVPNRRNKLISKFICCFVLVDIKKSL